MLQCSNVLFQHEVCLMAGLKTTLARLANLRHRFEKLTSEAKKSPAPSSRRKSRLRQIPEFGSNPGNLRMFAFVPKPLPRKPALVVALHGCSQTADGFAHGTGWSALAERDGFIVVFPEQQRTNNPQNCFSWFLPGDIQRGRGEALSIRQMVEHAIVEFGVDRNRVFVTGLSAGGAMASVMLATYPEVFAGGAIIAGLPYGCATSVQEALEAMFQERRVSARALGEHVRTASRYQGPWPKVSVWHGTADQIVKPANAEDIVGQWTHVHALSATPSHEEIVDGHRRRVWNNASGTTLIEAFSISGMGHGVPLSARNPEAAYGVPGPYFLDAGISSTRYIAESWDLANVAAEACATIQTVAPAASVGEDARTIDVTATTDHAIDSELPNFEPNENPGRRWPLNPNEVIAAAFKAAGLTVSGGATQNVAPTPIIEAALKAAGLMKR